MRLLPLAAALLLWGEAAADPFSAPTPLRTQPLSLPSPATGALEFRGALVVSPPFPEFGGLSGVLVSPGGETVAVSDRGRWLRFRLVIRDGRLVGAEDAALAPILGPKGAPLAEGQRDAEGLAREPGTGRLFVSYEWWNRVAVYEAPGGPELRRFAEKDWEALPDNRGIEGLAFDTAGALWAITEAEMEPGFASVRIKDGQGWRRKRLPLDGPYRPTGAEFGPDGALYVTERAFSLIGGFRARLRRFRFGAGAEPEAAETLLDLGAETMIDNIESVSIWEEGGETLLLLASDDNFFAFQRNVIALYALGE